jgi:arylsulfatase A-like enzyme
VSDRRDEPATQGGPVRGPADTLGLVRATVIAFACSIVANAIVLGMAEAPAQGMSVRGLHHLYQAGRHLAAALLVVLVIAVCRRLGMLAGRRGWLVLAGASLVVGAFTLVEDLSGFASSVLPSAPRIALWGMIAIVAGGVVGAAIAGRLAARPFWRWGAVAAGTAGLLVNPGLLESGYPGAHLYLAAACIALIAGALVTAPLPVWWPRVQAAVPWAIAAAVAVFSIVVPPSNSLLVQMLRQEGDVISPYLARVGDIGGQGEVTFPVEWEPWFRARVESDAVAPTGADFVPESPIVILLTIDSLRADVVADKKNDKRLPNLAKLRDRSVWFTRARAPGSQTVYTLAQLFMGTYYSQQYWSEHDGIRDLWPDDDETVRWPQLLSDAGVATAAYATTKWLVGELGIVRGFTEEEFVEPKSTRYSLTSETFPRIYERLEANGKGPLFVYTHALDAHYTVSPVKKGKGKKRYLANLEVVDENLGKLVAEIDRLGLKDRTILVVSSDHGEAFGEHDTKHHRSTVYEELLRVPLLIAGPGIKARKVDTPVTVMDIGPTVLDLFGQPTPGHIFGQSLVPFLAGKDPELTRPILAEGRLKKALVFPDGWKAIVDDRHHTAEVFDLVADPKEATNLLDSGDPRATERINVLKMFFDVHTYAKDGYTPPFRP